VNDCVAVTDAPPFTFTDSVVPVYVPSARVIVPIVNVVVAPHATNSDKYPRFTEPFCREYERLPDALLPIIGAYAVYNALFVLNTMKRVSFVGEAV
jgi:hypothetical protein